MSVRKALQRMVARARLDDGPALKDFDVALPPDSFEALRAECLEYGPQGLDAVTINTANGPLRVSRRPELSTVG